MTVFFKPYEGTRPYAFISYSHRQSAAVVDTIRPIYEKGLRLWYDEGIPAGSDWPSNIARHMNECEKVVFFLSREALASPNCFSEIRTAARLDKPVLVVRLDDSEPEGEWAGLLEDRTFLPVMDSASERTEAILRSGFLPRRFRRSRLEGVSFRAVGLIVSLALFLASAAVLAGLVTGRLSPFPDPEPPEPTASPAPSPTAVPVVDLGGAEQYFAVQFPDSQQERAVRRALDIPSGEIYRWQLAELSELYFCGNLVTDSPDSVVFDEAGVCRVNGAPVIMGSVSDLSLLKSAVRLERLALICQPLEDLEPLSGHALLRELSLSGSSVNTLGALTDLPSLTALHIEHTAVTDLRPLGSLPGLQTVTVSRDMLPLVWNAGSSFSVELARSAG